MHIVIDSHTDFWMIQYVNPVCDFWVLVQVQFNPLCCCSATCWERSVDSERGYVSPELR